VLSLAALLLWIIAMACLLGGAVWIGLGTGVLGFVAARYAADRRDDMELLWGVIFGAIVLLGLIRLGYALLH
jgi:hypothetical protein